MKSKIRPIACKKYSYYIFESILHSHSMFTPMLRFLTPSWSIPLHQSQKFHRLVGYVASIDYPYPCSLRIIVPTAQIIQPGFLVVYIATIPERIERSQRACHRAGFTQYLTPSIVLVFYYKRAGAVKNSHDASLQIVCQWRMHIFSLCVHGLARGAAVG